MQLYYQQKAKLSEFPENYANYDWNYIITNAFELCKDQNGSRVIQYKFLQANEEEKQQIFEAIESKCLILMIDPFANYVIQKIIEIGSQKIKEQIQQLVKNHLKELSFHTYGCRVVQKLIEAFKGNDSVQEEMILELKAAILDCIQDQNGNHVIQKCFEAIPTKKILFIIEIVSNKLDILACHAYGCRVIQKILENTIFKYSEQILTKLLNSLMSLCESQYGNYIIQNIVEKGTPQCKAKIIQELKKNFIEFSFNKFASNVIEKSLIYSDEPYREWAVRLLIENEGNNKGELIKIMKDQYGNYVIQTLYDKCNQKQKKRLFDQINQPQVLFDLKRSTYGKHVLSCIEKNQFQQQ